jgi:Zn-dependent peptidase ImmA (M78 family)
MPKGIPINPEVLVWAREIAGYQLEDLSRTFPKLRDWEKGAAYPTYLQLQTLANKYKRPSAVFFFPEPPDEETIEKSLRALSEEDVRNLNPQVRFLFRKAKTFQIYLKELFSDRHEEQTNKINWLKMDTQNSPIMLARQVRDIFSITPETQSLWKTFEQALEEWRAILAKHGIYIFKDAFKNNKISGFCIYDGMFPIIYINNSHSKSRQIFTLFHELAHLIFKQNYLDVLDENNLYLNSQDPSNIEVKCNAFAGSFLIPDIDFIDRFSFKNYDLNKIEEISDFYKVSKEVVLRSLLSNKLIDDFFYKKIMKEWKISFENKDKEKSSKSDGGGNYYYTTISYLGNQYFSLIFEKFYHGRISVEKASAYLDIKPKFFPVLENEYLKRGLSNVRI